MKHIFFKTVCQEFLQGIFAYCENKHLEQENNKVSVTLFAPPEKKIKFDNTPVSNYESFLYVNNSMNRLNLAHTFKMSFKIRQENGCTAELIFSLELVFL